MDIWSEDKRQLLDGLEDLEATRYGSLGCDLLLAQYFDVARIRVSFRNHSGLKWISSEYLFPCSRDWIQSRHLIKDYCSVIRSTIVLFLAFLEAPPRHPLDSSFGARITTRKPPKPHANSAWCLTKSASLRKRSTSR